MEGLLQTPFFPRYLTRVDKFVVSCVSRACFYNIDREKDKVDLFSACITQSSLEVLNWLKPREIEERHVELAIRYKKDDMLKQFLDSGIVCNVAEFAAIWGRKDLLDRMPYAWKFINVVKVLESGNHWLIPDDVPLLDEYLRDCDILPLETLKWFHQKANFVVDLRHMTAWFKAARTNVESMRYLLEVVGFIPNSRTLYLAAGNDEVFDYVYSRCNLDALQFMDFTAHSSMKHLEKVLKISTKFNKEEQMTIIQALLDRHRFKKAAFLYSRGFAANPEDEKIINQFQWTYEGLFEKNQPK